MAPGTADCSATARDKMTSKGSEHDVPYENASPEHASLIVKLKIRTVVKDANGLLDPTPRGHCIAIAHLNDTTSPFLLLPAELRNRIYALALPGFTIYDVSSTGHTTVHFSGYRPRSLSLLSVCRRIYSEARLFPFANLAILADTSSAHPNQIIHPQTAPAKYDPAGYLPRRRVRSAPLDALLPVQRDAITLLRVHWDPRDRFRGAILDELEGKPGVKRVFVEREDSRQAQKRALQMRIWPSRCGTRRSMCPLFYQAIEDEASEDESTENNSIPSITARMRPVVGPDVDILFPYHPLLDGNLDDSDLDASDLDGSDLDDSDEDDSDEDDSAQVTRMTVTRTPPRYPIRSTQASPFRQLRPRPV